MVTSAELAQRVLRLTDPDKRVLVIVQRPDVEQIARLLAQGATGICTPRDAPEDVDGRRVKPIRGLAMSA